MLPKELPGIKSLRERINDDLSTKTTAPSNQLKKGFFLTTARTYQRAIGNLLQGKPFYSPLRGGQSHYVQMAASSNPVGNSYSMRQVPYK